MVQNEKSQFFQRLPGPENKKGLVVFFIAVVLASVFWLFQSFERKYVSSIDVRMKYVNLPDQKILKYPLPANLKVRFEARGWDIMKLKRYQRDNPLIFDLQKFSKQGLVHTANLKGILVSEEIAGVTILHIQPDTIHVGFDKIASKKVRIKTDIHLGFDKQFGLSGPLRIEPSEVLLKGPASEITRINYIHTTKMSYSKLNKRIEEDVRLLKPANSNISCELMSVRIIIPVEKLTEGKFVLPIRLSDNLKDSINLIPDKVTVKFQAALSIFNSINSGFFDPVISEQYVDQIKGDKLKVNCLLNNEYLYKVSVSPEFVDFIITK